jgi:hypothetical protein
LAIVMLFVSGGLVHWAAIRRLHSDCGPIAARKGRGRCRMQSRDPIPGDPPRDALRGAAEAPAFAASGGGGCSGPSFVPEAAHRRNARNSGSRLKKEI